MTSASIMEMQKTGFVSQANTTKTPPVNTSVQFSDAMDFAAAGQQGGEETTLQKTEVKTSEPKNVAEHTTRKEIREAEKAEPKAEVSEEEISDEMEVKEEAVVKEIAEKLGVSEEEVREAMEILGLTVADLISQGNMAMLVAGLTGMQAVDVLTDENLFAQITELTESVQNQLQDVADSLGISLEQLCAQIETQAVKAEADVQTQMPEMVSEETVAPETVEVTENAEEFTQKVSVENESTERVPETEEGSADTELRQNVHLQDGQNAETAEHQQKGSEREAEDMQAGANVQIVKGDAAVATQVSTDELFAGRMDAEQAREMINQIADYVRVHRSENLSSMEIQLHPVELGTVNLQVVAKDGSVSARLTVQDEAVRAAIESQVALLRESLQEQGLKIDAVEVTVATHEFEQNLDQHGKEAEENAAKEKKNGRKILDLNEIGQEELESGEMSDADRLQVEMMRMGGNRLNLRG